MGNREADPRGVCDPGNVACEEGADAHVCHGSLATGADFGALTIARIADCLGYGHKALAEFISGDGCICEAAVAMVSMPGQAHSCSWPAKVRNRRYLRVSPQ